METGVDLDAVADIGAWITREIGKPSDSAVGKAVLGHGKLHISHKSEQPCLEGTKLRYLFSSIHKRRGWSTVRQLWTIRAVPFPSKAWPVID